MTARQRLDKINRETTRAFGDAEFLKNALEAVEATGMGKILRRYIGKGVAKLRRDEGKARSKAKRSLAREKRFINSHPRLKAEVDELRDFVKETLASGRTES